MREKVASISEIKPGQCKTVEVGGVAVAIFNIKGQFYAVADSCTHMGAPLSTGYTANGTITCEWHGATFDLTTGEALCAPAKDPLAVYKLYINGDDLEIEY